jgi:hypothetical protein
MNNEQIQCPGCELTKAVVKHSVRVDGMQIYHCKHCMDYFTEGTEPMWAARGTGDSISSTPANAASYRDLKDENRRLNNLVDMHEKEQDHMLGIASAAELARNRILLFLNSNGPHKGLQEALDELEKHLVK